MRPARPFLAAATVAPVAPVPHLALAQSDSQTGASGPGGEAGPGSSGAIGQIIITANKCDENVQDVPISLTEYSGDQLNAQGVTNTTGITEHNPDAEGQSMVA